MGNKASLLCSIKLRYAVSAVCTAHSTGLSSTILRLARYLKKPKVAVDAALAYKILFTIRFGAACVSQSERITRD